MKHPELYLAGKVRISSERNASGKPLYSETIADDNNRPATKQDLDALREELIEQMRDMQTEVLRAFHDWARPVEIRLRALPNIEERLGHLEERVSAIERRGRV